MFPTLAKYFVRGLLVIAPVALTGYVAYLVFTAVDGWINMEPLLDRSVSGAGVFVTIVLITFTGFLASNVLTRWFFNLTDRLFSKLPLVKLLYGSFKDLIGALVGEQRKFDKAVRILPAEGSDIQLLGFLTRDSIPEVGLDEHVSVYVPMAYNVGGAMMMVPRDRIVELDVDGAAAMTFVLSGGVSGIEPGKPAPT